MPCHCVEHAVTQVRRRLTTLEPSYSVRGFFAQPLFRKMFAKTLGPLLFPTVIEGAVGFKTHNAYATQPLHPRIILQPLHIPLHALLNRVKLTFIARRPQTTQIGLCEALIATFQFIREGDVDQLALIVGLEHPFGHIVEALATSGADIKDTGDT